MITCIIMINAILPQKHIPMFPQQALTEIDAAIDWQALVVCVEQAILSVNISHLFDYQKWTCKELGYCVDERYE